MVKKLDKDIDDLVNTIVSSYDYKECLRLKEAMKKNSYLNDLISKIKELQKEYVRSSYDNSIKTELDKLEQELNSIPIYYSYNNHLAKVNHAINFVKDEFNDYFYNLLISNI